jgi:hypothetical protein
MEVAQRRAPNTRDVSIAESEESMGKNVIKEAVGEDVVE